MSRSRNFKVGAMAASLLALAIGFQWPLTAWAVERPPQVGEMAPDFELRSVQGKKVGLSATLKDGPVVLVVLRGFPGYQCPLCNRQVAELIQAKDRFQAAGAKVLLVYPGPSQGLAAKAREFIGEKAVPKNFTLLLDPDYEFTTAYGLRWEAPMETAYPSTFVLDKSGKTIYSKVSMEHGGRARTSDVLDALKPVAASK